MLLPFLLGVSFTAALIASLLFLEFWKKTKDRLFLMFALAFGLLCLERILTAFMASGNEFKVYFIRLLAFTVILIAIIGKNRARSGRSGD